MLKYEKHFCPIFPKFQHINEIEFLLDSSASFYHKFKMFWIGCKYVLKYSTTLNGINGSSRTYLANHKYLSPMRNFKFRGSVSLHAADTASWIEWQTHLIRIRCGIKARNLWLTPLVTPETRSILQIGIKYYLQIHNRTKAKLTCHDRSIIGADPSHPQ